MVRNWGVDAGKKPDNIIISEERPDDPRSSLHEAVAIGFMVVCASALVAALAVGVAVTDALISSQ